MRNYELLDLIGEADEDFVLAADTNEARRRSRWTAWLACAACAAVVLCAYPAWRALRPQNGSFADTTISFAAGSSADSGPFSDPVPAPEATALPEERLIEAPGLHSYIEVGESRNVMTTDSDTWKQQIIPFAPVPAPAAGSEATEDAAVGSSEADGGRAEVFDYYGEQGGPYEDAAVQDEAYEQSRNLLLWLFGTDLPVWGMRYPDWYGGCWIDNSCQPARLAVAIVEEFHTPAQEAQIRSFCGGTGEILFPSVKYSHNDLMDMMDQIGQVFEKLNCGVYLSYGLDEMENRVGLDFFDTPSDEVLAALAELDPDGDAIFIQVFIGSRIQFTDGAEEALKPPETNVIAIPDSAAEPSPPPTPAG